MTNFGFLAEITEYALFAQAAAEAEKVYVTFGSYEQDNDLTNGKEDIEWLVLARDENKALLISRYSLDNQPYSEHTEEVPWENCSLRKWCANGLMIIF